MPFSTLQGQAASAAVWHSTAVVLKGPGQSQGVHASDTAPGPQQELHCREAPFITYDCARAFYDTLLSISSVSQTSCYYPASHKLHGCRMSYISLRVLAACGHCLQEEQAKRAARAKKFGLPEDRQAPLQYAPDPEDAKRAARAKKFGAAYQPPTADTLLQKAGVCAWHLCSARFTMCIVWHTSSYAGQAACHKSEHPLYQWQNFCRAVVAVALLMVFKSSISALNPSAPCVYQAEICPGCLGSTA